MKGTLNFPLYIGKLPDQLLNRVKEGHHPVYAVPGHPMVAEKTVEILLQEGASQGVTVDIQGGSSFLDPVFACLSVDPVDGFLLLDGTDLKEDQLNPQVHQLITQVYDRMVASEVKLSLMEWYPDDYPVTIVTAAGVAGQEQVIQIPLFELDRKDAFGNLSTVYVPPSNHPEVLHRQFGTLKGIISRLRAPGGCPWDRKQTHESLRPYLLEEAYEFLEAVAQEDREGMMDELGDVLLQVLLHAQIASETGDFTIRDVVRNLADKMVRRHPHVFADDSAEDASEVKEKWEQIKQRERASEEGKNRSMLEGIPDSFPALLRAMKLQKKAARAGFGWRNPEEIHHQLKEELNELFAAASSEEKEEEVGDLFFTAVALSRYYNVDPEQALLGTCRKFFRRFQAMEKEALKLGQPLETFEREQLERWWNHVKRGEPSEK